MQRGGIAQVDQMVLKRGDHALLSRASPSSKARLSLVVRWPSSSTRMKPLQEGTR
jgi:hypothetical protein